MKMSFGKHKGTEMRFCPADYLEWIVNDSEIEDEELVEAAKEELQRKVDEGIIAFRRK